MACPAFAVTRAGRSPEHKPRRRHCGWRHLRAGWHHFPCLIRRDCVRLPVLILLHGNFGMTDKLLRIGGASGFWGDAARATGGRSLDVCTATPDQRKVADAQWSGMRPGFEVWWFGPKHITATGFRHGGSRATCRKCNPALWT